MEAELLDWYRRNARDLPWRRARDPYAILVSEVMAQQTQVRIKDSQMRPTFSFDRRRWAVSAGTKERAG